MQIAYIGISQTLNQSDTVCLPVNQLKIAINKIEVCEVIKIELAQTKYLIDLKNTQIYNQDSIINLYKKKNTKNLQLIENLKIINSNYQKNIFNCSAKVEYQEKIIKRKNNFKYVFGIVGIILGIFISK